MKQTIENCGCCEGIEIVTPQPVANRPGLTALFYRIGTHATFLESMLARLSSSDYPKLAELTTREADDPAIALLDAWATIADVLTFYNERIVNEGYLRTATERRSIVELARLVGYKLRPGVSSSVYLAYTLDDNFKDEVIIPKDARSQSIPVPGELPQSFEISEDLKARAKWNNLKPRITRPQTRESIQRGNGKNAQIYLKGISTNLKPNDPLLIHFADGNKPKFFRIKEVIPDAVANRTLVILQEKARSKGNLPPPEPINLIGDLTLLPSAQLANSLKLQRNVSTLFSGDGIVPKGSPEKLRNMLAAGEASHVALKAFSPVLRDTLATAVENAQVTELSKIRVYALRNKASLFGHNMPLPTPVIEDPESVKPFKPLKFDQKILALDAEYKEIKPHDWIAIERQVDNLSKICHVETVTAQTLGGPLEGELAFFSTESITTETKINNKLTSTSHSDPIRIKSTVLKLKDEWLDAISAINEPNKLLRNTSVYFQSEELELAEVPIQETVRGGTDQLLELDGLYEGLESGRWVIVSGERDLAGTSGVRFSELTMLASVTQNVGAQIEEPEESKNEFEPNVLEGDRFRTFIKLANKLKYEFKRDTVTIYGNVVKATHGETRKEVLGSGDGAKALQSFILKQPPLTYVPASNPSGVDSTLKVSVNDVQWRETDALVGLSPNDRQFVTKTDDEGKTIVIFGNGREGARLPTGIENIKAEYRNGIGQSGNVNAGQISLLTNRPQGVKEVINPLRASGGADKEKRDQARKNAPLAVKALDRLVSVQDYEDFSRAYAGIGKACAMELPDGRRQLVHVTIAGAEDIPIDKNSDLYRNLRQSLFDYGDPYQAIQLEIRELVFIVIEARIRILPEYLWELVVTNVRAALLDAFSFERRELGQDVLLSEVLSVMQAVRGVAYVDVDVLRGIPEKIVDTLHPGQRRLLTPGEIKGLVSSSLKDKDDKEIKEPLTRLSVNLADWEKGTVRPAQLAFLTPEVPATLALNQIT